MKLTDIINSIFITSNRKLYKNITIEEKETNFFIINRYISKRYPKLSQELNTKGINKSDGLDIIFLNISHEEKPPYWIWSKTKSVKTIYNKDLLLIRDKYNIKISDTILLSELYSDDMNEEIKSIKKEIKENGI